MTLACQCLGDKSKPALVLLHGFMGSMDDWQPLVSHLEAHCYLVLVDLPGHGGSLLGSHPGFNGFAHRLEQTLTTQGLPDYSLLGYSLGGRLAMAYTQEYQHRVKQLLLEGAHPGLEKMDEREQRHQSDQQWADRFHHEPVKEVLQDWYQQAVFAVLSENQRSDLIEVRRHQSGQDLSRAMMAFSLSEQPDYRPFLRQNSASVHFLVGERDSKFSKLGQMLLDDDCLNELHVIQQSGHNIHREQPKALANKLLSIIGRGGR